MRRIALITVTASLAGWLLAPAAPAAPLSDTRLTAAQAKTYLSSGIAEFFEGYGSVSTTFGTCSRRSARAVNCKLKVAYTVQPTSPRESCAGSLTAVLYRTRTGRLRVRSNLVWAYRRNFICPPTAPRVG